MQYTRLFGTLFAVTAFAMVAFSSPVAVTKPIVTDLVARTSDGERVLAVLDILTHLHLDIKVCLEQIGALMKPFLSNPLRSH
jgi:hypothetical protein